MAAALDRLPRLRARAWAAIFVVVIAAAVGGWLWLRDSSLVGVERVIITGVTGAEATRVEQALTEAARSMTTLHVEEDRLRAAVAAYPQVKDLRARPDLLHDLRITVTERPPVAALTVGDQRTPIAADGTLLKGRVSADALPTVQTNALPGGGRLTGGRAATVIGVLAEAPAPLRRHIERIEIGPQGIQAQLRGGPRVLLGTPDRPRAKWIATGRVLGDPNSAGAGYIDVRLPERAAVGGFTEAAIGEVVPSTGG
jgi:cell division protein FtsQ